MSKFFIIKSGDQATSGVFRKTFKDAFAYAEGWKQLLPSIAIHETAYKPEPNDTEVSWVVYYTINGTEFSEVFKTRELARMEKKYLQDSLEHFVEKPYNIYIQREELWVVDKKKVS